MAKQSTPTTYIHDEWLMELKFSMVGDFNSAPRISGIVDMRTCDSKLMLLILYNMKMPVFLHWGNIDRPLHASDYNLDDGSVPDPADIAHLHSAFTSGDPLPKPNKTNEPSLVPDATLKNLPPVEKHSGQ
jgi:hypothetical protein